LEAVTWWFSRRALEKGHDITLITTKGSPMAGKCNPKTIKTKTTDAKEKKKQVLSSSTLTVLETIDPVWDVFAEKDYYLSYRNLLESEYGEGQGIVWDNTWLCYSYLSAKNYPKMKIVHTHHGITASKDYPLPNVSVSSPRFIGLSRPHARYLSSALGIGVRCVHNGIPLPPKTKGEVGKTERNKNKNYNDKDKEYLLSLNRILHEKGIHNAIDIAIETENRIKIVGDDIHGVDSLYVKKIKEKCRNSKGYAEYYGLVDNNTKKEILKNCKAVVGCPEPTWLEAFGLYAVEANAYGKPILALNNGGLNDIVVNGVNGFLGEAIEELKKYIPNLDQCTPESCRKRVEEMFTDKIMTTNYLSIFEKVLEDDPGYRW